MIRTRRILRWTGATLVIALLLALAAPFIILNTAPGRDRGEQLVASLTNNQVRLQGLTGRFPDHLRLAHLELHDAAGPWLLADDIALDWTPIALLHRQALISNLHAASLQLARLPASEPRQNGPQNPSKPLTLPLRVTLEALTIDRATLGPSVAGTPATFTIAAAADLPSLQDGQLKLDARRLDAQADYVVNATIGDRIEVGLSAVEVERGLLAHLASLPDVGPISLAAHLAGPRNALETRLQGHAGSLDLDAHGTIDLQNNAAIVDIAATAPEMHPAPGVGWHAITLQAHAAGPFTAPDVTGHLHAETLEAAGLSLATLDADLSGNAGQARLAATLATLRIPGPNPAHFAADPIHLAATAQLDAPTRPVRFTIEHPLLAAQGTARTAGPLGADATLRLPNLAPLGALANLVLAGSTELELHAARATEATNPEAITIEADGALALTAAPAPALPLLGPAARYGLSARIAGPAITLTRLTLSGTALHLDATGTSGPPGQDLTAKLALANVALIAPTLTGAATLDAHLHGPADALALQATLAGTIGAPGIPPAPLRVAAALTGLPTAPAGHVTAEGTLAGAPIQLALDAARDQAGTLTATITRADWRSLHAEGALTLPAGATLPQGRISLRAPHLEDLRPVLAQPIAGALTATLQLDADAAVLEAEARNAGLPTARVGHATLHARVAAPLTRPVLAATLAAEGIAAGANTATARLEANGPADALALKLAATVHAPGAEAQLATQALLDTTARQLRLNTLQLTASTPSLKPETLRLLAPATLRFADAVSLDHLRLGLHQAVLDVSGRLAPTLDATLTLRTPADIAAILAPEAALDGAIALDAHLTGSPAQPGGTVKLSATALRARTGPGRALPPATLTATAQLAAGAARLEARATAGAAQLTLNGQAPLGPGPLNLRAAGTLDLALLDPILTAAGRRARGRLALDAAITGTAAAPTLAGTAQLTAGELQDFAQGVHLTALAGTARLEGQSLRIAALTGRAGPGTIALAGTIGVLAPARPVDLAITLRNARPLATDTISADLDADLTLRGPLAGLAAAGTVTIRRADLRIPNSLPASVVVLPVRRPGDRPPAPAAPATPVALDLTVSAPQAVYLRGRGVDAEMSGALRIRGTSAAPQVSGGLEMRRGSVSVAGTSLTFSRGKVGFDGTGVTGKIDPTLDFAADSTTSGVTATLSIGGYVSKPKITLSSVPDLPQDEVLAYLLFKRSAKDLGPFQIASIAAGLAELSGIAGGGLNPLDNIRKGLGLDRLAVGTGGNSAGGAATGSGPASTAPTVEAGRYVANGVYVGAKQGTTGGQTQATVQIDITKGLKVETDVGSGTGGNQVGLTYQFEY